MTLTNNYDINYDIWRPNDARAQKISFKFSFQLNFKPLHFPSFTIGTLSPNLAINYLVSNAYLQDLILLKWKTARFDTYSITTSEWLIRRNPAHCWKDLSPSPLINFNWFRLINGPLFSRHSIKLLAFVWFNPATLLRQIKIINLLHCTTSAFYSGELKNSTEPYLPLF